MSVRFPLTGLPTRAARWSATHPWRAIGAWFLFVVVAVGLAAAVPTEHPTDADYRVGESGRAELMADAAGLGDAPTENVLVTATDGALDPADAEAAADLEQSLAAAERQLSDYRNALHRRISEATGELIARYRESPSLCLSALPLPPERPAR